MPGRVGNADLYIGMVRKRKSLPRDSKGFEPIEAYLREVEEDLNQKSSSSEGESGEETDVEEEKRKEEEARELKIRERERRQREQRERREREKKEKEIKAAEEEREKKAKQDRKAKEEREKERRIEEEREAQQKATTANQEEVQQVTDSDKEGKKGATRTKKSGRKGSRRSLRQRGISASDTESSATDTEETVAGPGTTAAADIESDFASARSGSEREGEKKKTTTAKRSRKSTALSKTAVTAEVERGGESELGDGGSGGGGGGGEKKKVDSATLYSPEVTVSSPTRDTVKLGPVRLTFSASPSDDEQRRRRNSDHNYTTAAAEKKITSRRTLTLPASEPVNPLATDPERGSGTEGEEQNDTRKDSSSRFLTRHNNTTNMSFNPKTTSTQVRGAGKRVGVVKEKASVGKRGKRTLARDPESEEEEEEEDPELLSLLEPSARVSRLVGLSQLGHQSTMKTAVRGRKITSREKEETTDNEATVATGRSRAKSTVSKPGRRSAIRPSAPETESHVTTSKKTTKKPSRKSVAFNPHTTNLGSPELVPPATSGNSPSTDTGGSSGGGVYDYVPSDEEDFTHNKSRLYSPRRKSILRKAAESAKKRDGEKTPGQRQEGVEMEREEEEEEEEGASGSGGEMNQEVGDGGRKVRELSIQVKDISKKAKETSKKRTKKTKATPGKGKEAVSKDPAKAKEVPGSVEQDEIPNEDDDGQWFVPNELSLHQMISERSPRPLQRLTRTGRRSALPLPADLTTSSHISTAPRPKKKRRPRELDSTRDTGVDGGGGGSEGETRETNLGSESGGASSADEAGSSSSGKSRRSAKTKESTSVGSAGGKNTTRRKSKLKLTPSWMQRKSKRVTPPSDTGHTDEEREEEEEEEEHTPASKKQRVSTQEEDEGMQSGGGLSLSSSEEGEPQDLVRSLGGRRYRRYTVEYQNPKTPGVRRSKRTRVAPIQQWKNEEPEYERRRSGVTLKGVLVPVEGPERRRGKRKRASPPTINMTPPPLVYTDRRGVRRSLDVVAHPSLCGRLNGQGESIAQSEDLSIIKLFSEPSTTCGLIELTFLGEKEKSSSSTHEMYFFVLKGRPQFLVERQKYDLTVESQIRIPVGVVYAIKNTHRTLARLYFYSHLVR